MHDLTIADIHTYYVLAGNTPVLVHNCGGGLDANGNSCACASATPINWNANSVKTFGHTFKDHGARVKKLADRARSTGNPQGQWDNDSVAAGFLRDQYDPSVKAGAARDVPLPDGVTGRVTMPDGSVRQATHARLVAGRNGPYKSAFPIA